MSSPIVAFLPCRAGSERVPKKNTRMFNNLSFGLFENKINQLIKAKLIDKIIISTDDDLIIGYLQRDFSNNDKIILHKRDQKLSSSLTSTDDLITHAGSLINSYYSDCNILWTHVTSPFIEPDTYDSAIDAFHTTKAKGFDSLMSVTSIKNFLWDESGPINYRRDHIKWPFTQSIKKLFEVNSGLFIAPLNTYLMQKDRIGNNPYLYELNKIVGFDIDWEEDFQLAELYAQQVLIK